MKLRSGPLRTIAIIPARFESSRFPGKALTPILGKTLIERTYTNGLRCSLLDELIVATDDERIFDHVKKFGGRVEMTQKSCLNGTERIVELYLNHYQHADPPVEIIINLQGDEPCIEPTVIESVISTLQGDPTAVMATAITPIASAAEAYSSSVVKCVIDCNHNALYFSRALIPATKEGERFHSEHNYYRHIGIYGYRPSFLLQYVGLPSTPLQKMEDLEQLKVLEHGFGIKTAIVASHSFDVNTPEDVKRVEEFLCKQNISSSLEGSAPP